MDRWLSHIDSSTVLWGQFIIYTVYCLAIISLVAWFALRISNTKPSWFKVSPKLFYGWVIFLVVVGVGLHITTFLTIPWSRVDLSGTGDVQATYNITIGYPKDDTNTRQKDAQGNFLGAMWTFDQTQLDADSNLPVPCDELVKFSVTSTDLTYGFGIFRENRSLVAQMQVVPGHPNDLSWMFVQDGTYYIMSTEYSGPLGSDLVADTHIVVTGCQ